MDDFNSQNPIDDESVQNADSFLAKLRKGNNQKLEIGLGDLKMPVRLLDAAEEATVIVQAEAAAIKHNPTGIQEDVFKAQITMKQILMAATLIDKKITVPKRFFDKLTHPELTELYNQYTTLNHTINPNINALSQEDILKIIDGVKKKHKAASDFYTWQLAGIGKYFLEILLPFLQMAKEPGTD